MTTTTSDVDRMIQRDRDILIHPYLPDSVTERVVMNRGRMCQLWDIEGREYLDATGGLWLAQVGHSRPEIAEAAYEQMKTLEYFTSFWEFSNNRAIELAERLVSLTPDGIDRVYFTSGGSEGNEAAIKMARYYHWRHGEKDRNWIIARNKAYHGVAYGGGTATGFDIYHDGFGPMMPNVAHVTPPWPYRKELFNGQDPCDFLLKELEETIDHIGPSKIAAMIGEPIMGVGGMLAPPADYWTRVETLLRSHGILLIFDEVVTAYGRTGEWFASQYYGVTPDITVTAKGITSGYSPLGAVLVTSEVGAVLASDTGFPMGYTYNGHPTACAIALANLDIIEREGLLKRATEVGDYLSGRLEELLELPIVGEVRHVGMMLAVELVTSKESRTPLPMVQPMLPDVIRRETGVIVRDCAHNLVLSPPLVMTHEEADRAAEAIRSVLRRTNKDGTVD
jgi:putrescine aminotransferase